MLEWRYMSAGSPSFSPEQPIMNLNGYVFNHVWALNAQGKGMAIYSFGPGDGSSNLGFNPFE